MINTIGSILQFQAVVYTAQLSSIKGLIAAEPEKNLGMKLETSN